MYSTYSVYFVFFFITQTFSYTVVDRVYNGQAVRPHSYKYLVKLAIDTASSCSGSIIHNFWIISASHCFTHDNLMKVSVFHHTNLNKPLDQGSLVVTHPSYDKRISNNKESAYYDIALVKTVDYIQFNEYVQPIALGYWEPFDQQGNIAGYGLTEPNMTVPRETNVRIYKCSRLICTKGTTRPAGGDSGGPLVVSDMLVGIICGYDTIIKETY
ncbi:trypsin-5-like [Achroia grisella]|uniref:trypsin-5-like n=1 Tax=Achroia grisella TaxID=688607 RepID=UPI0027D2F54E|nr:trypsin-5-like [Achroia grisella]